MQMNSRVTWISICIFCEKFEEALVIDVKADTMMKGATAIVSIIKILKNLSSMPNDLFIFSGRKRRTIIKRATLRMRRAYIKRKSKLLTRGLDERPNFLNQAKPLMYSGIFSSDYSCFEISKASSGILKFLMIHSERLPLWYNRLSITS